MTLAVLKANKISSGKVNRGERKVRLRCFLIPLEIQRVGEFQPTGKGDFRRTVVRLTRGLFGKITLGDGNINGKLDPIYFLNNKDHPS